jgi:hypothetical protein
MNIDTEKTLEYNGHTYEVVETNRGWIAMSTSNDYMKTWYWGKREDAIWAFKRLIDFPTE